jgi:hypothetical protein
VCVSFFNPLGFPILFLFRLFYFFLFLSPFSIKRYEVFVNIRNDEREHWKTLCSLVQFGGLEYGGSLQRGQGNSLDSFEGGAEGGSCLGGGGGQRRESALQVVGTLPAPSPSNV